MQKVNTLAAQEGAKSLKEMAVLKSVAFFDSPPGHEFDSPPGHASVASPLSLKKERG